VVLLLRPRNTLNSVLLVLPLSRSHETNRRAPKPHLFVGDQLGSKKNQKIKQKP
jgi:hypothetical protein